MSRLDHIRRGGEVRLSHFEVDGTGDRVGQVEDVTNSRPSHLLDCTGRSHLTPRCMDGHRQRDYKIRRMGAETMEAMEACRYELVVLGLTPNPPLGGPEPTDVALEVALARIDRARAARSGGHHGPTTARSTL